MIMSAAKGKHDLVLTSDDFREAVDTLDEVEIKMGLVFKGVGKSDIASFMNKATGYFLRSATKEIPYFQFARHFQTDMDKMMMDRVLSTLEASNMIKVLNRPGGETTILVLEGINGKFV